MGGVGMLHRRTSRRVVLRAALVAAATALAVAAAAVLVDQRRDAAAERAVHLSVAQGYSYLDEHRGWVTRIVNAGPNRITLAGSGLVAPGVRGAPLDVSMPPGSWAELPVPVDQGCAPGLASTQPDSLELRVVTHRGTTTLRRVPLLRPDAERLQALLRAEECGPVEPADALDAYPTSAVEAGQEIHLELSLRNVGRFDTITLSSPRLLPGLSLDRSPFPLVLEPNDSRRAGPDEKRLSLVLRVDDCDAARPWDLGTKPLAVVRVDNGRQVAEATLRLDHRPGVDPDQHPDALEGQPPSATYLVKQICGVVPRDGAVVGR